MTQPCSCVVCDYMRVHADVCDNMDLGFWLLGFSGLPVSLPVLAPVHTVEALEPPF